MPQADLVIRGRRVLLPGGLAPASIHVSSGRITAVTAFEKIPTGAEIVEAGEIHGAPRRGETILSRS